MGDTKYKERHTSESHREPMTLTDDSLIAPVKRPAALGLWRMKIGPVSCRFNGDRIQAKI